MSERIEEIRERVERAAGSKPWEENEFYQADFTEQAAREDIPYLLERIDELERENERLRLDNWDMTQELETRVTELVRLLGELPDEAQEIREEATSELTCIEETLKRCGA